MNQPQIANEVLEKEAQWKGEGEGEIVKIKLVEVKMKRKGEKWKESSAVFLIDSLLPILQD